MPLLAPEEMSKVADAAMRRDFPPRRAVLLADMEPSYRNTLETSTRPTDQLYLDLSALNRTITAVAGQLPLRLWLMKASLLSQPFPEDSAFFRGVADGLHEQAPAPPEEIATSAQTAMADMRGLAQGDPRIAQALRNARGELEKLTRELKPVGVHKRLHDLLHAYQIEKLPVIKDALNGDWTQDSFRKDTLVDMVASFTLTLQSGRGELDRLKPDTPDRRQPEDWLRALTGAHQRLAAAVAADAMIDSQAALRDLRSEIARRMSKLNVLMWNRAESLGIDQLVERLRGFAADWLQIDDARAVLLRATATQLAAMGLEIHDLLNEHYRWQAFEEALWDAEDDLVYKDESAYAFGAFAERWPILIAQVSELGGTPPGEWLAPAQQYAVAFASFCPLPITPPVDVRARQQFRRFVTRVRQQFYQVDSALDASCNRLSVITDPIEDLARSL